MKKLALLMAVLMLAVAAFTVSAFEDVNIGDDCFEAVNTLVSLNVIKGKTATTFAPDEPVTREQMAMLFTRLYTTVNFENGENGTPFTDLDDPYYNSVIAWCYDAKVINGTTPTTFEPKGNIIYQDGLTMACRLLGYTDLTYPLGNITKARLIGLTEGLEDLAYDKEMTRGEVAILLYNALEAEGAQIIKENKVKYYSGFPILETVERNFEIAVDVYNFKKETYLIVGTESFNLAGYSKADTETSYNLILIDTDTDEIVAGARETNKEFEDIAVAEDTNSDDNILSYIEVLYRGDSLDDKKAIVLSSVINSDLDSDAEVAVYFKKDKNSDKLVAQTDKLLINGKAYDVDEKVYTVSNRGVITPATGDLSVDAPVFFQADKNDVGAYAQRVIDTNKDGEPEYIMFFPMSFQKIAALTSKGVYTIKAMDAAGGSVKFDTKDEDCTLVINAEAAKNDYVLTYNYGPFTVIDQVVEPVITTVTRRTGSSSARKYTLATGDVVTFAKTNNPVAGLVSIPSGNDLTPSTKEVALYVVNDKIVYTDDANASGYDPYTYAFFVSKGDQETSVDTEDGTIETVNTAIAFMGGKAVTIPVKLDAGDTFYDLNKPCMITILDIEDGKYDIAAGMQTAEAYNAATGEGYEIQLGSSTLYYDSYAKVQKITDGRATYIVNFDANTEFYAETQSNNVYESVKRYTMANMPQLEKPGSNNLVGAIIRVNKDGDDKVTSYTLVVAYSQVGSTLGDTDNYSDYRIVLEKGIEVNKKSENFIVYEVLNPITGAIETITDTKSDVSTAFNEGTLVRKQSGGYVTKVSNPTDVFVGSNLASGAYTRQLMQINTVINNGTLATVYSGTNKAALNSSTGTEIVLNNVKVVVLDIDENGDYVIDTTDDYDELNGKIVRTFVTSGLNYKSAYMVIVPWQWADAAGFTGLDEAYDDYADEYVAPKG